MGGRKCLAGMVGNRCRRFAGIQKLGQVPARSGRFQLLDLHRTGESIREDHSVDIGALEGRRQGLFSHQHADVKVFLLKTKVARNTATT